MIKHFSLIIILLSFYSLSIGQMKQNKNIQSKEFLQTFFSEETFKQFIEQNEKEYDTYMSKTNMVDTLIIEDIDQSDDYGSEERNNFLLIINNLLFDEDIDSIFQIYKSDVESEGYSVKIISSTNTHKVTQLRDYLRSEWETNNIKGAFLVGDLPVPWFEMANDFGDEDSYTKFPTDLYFSDLDGDWYDRLENGVSGVFDDHNGFRTEKADIWIGRIYPSAMKARNKTQKELVLTYFDKVHKYRTGDLRLKDQTINYIDKDWNGYGIEPVASQAYDQMTTYRGEIDIQCSREDYRSRIQHMANNRFEWMYLAAHSWHKEHHFHHGTPFPSSWIDMIRVQVLFYLNFNCSAALFTGDDCICSWYVMQKHYGLISVGSSKTGSMLSQRPYYEYVGKGYNIGESFLNWSKLHMEDTRSWHYGMIVLGDPTLKIGRFMDNPGPEFLYSLSPEDDNQYEQKVPEFRWTKTDSAEYYVVKLYTSAKIPVFISEQLTDTTLTIPIDQYPSTDENYSWFVQAYTSENELYDFTQRRSFSIFYPDTTVKYLSDYQPDSYEQDWGTLTFDKTINGNTMSIAGQKFNKGLGSHANSKIIYTVNGNYDKFSVFIGHDDESDSDNDDGVTFEIKVDDITAFGPSEAFNCGDTGKRVEVDVNDGSKLTLLIDKRETDYNDHANWADAKLIKSVTSIDNYANNNINEFRLISNYPNPFNPTTKITYSIEKQNIININIYNIVGEKVNTLLNTSESTGQYTIEWNGKDNFGNSVPSGVYICKMQSGNNISLLKMMLIR